MKNNTKCSFRKQLLMQKLTLKKRSNESWIERSGRVFFLRGRSMDKSLNCSRLVTTSPQLQHNREASDLCFSAEPQLYQVHYRNDSWSKWSEETGLTLCRRLCAAPQTPCWPPQHMCRCGRCLSLHQVLLWLVMTLLFPPDYSHTPQMMMMLHHLSNFCLFSPHRPSAGPNTDSKTHEHPKKLVTCKNLELLYH